jgi:hypothetical protein
LVPEKAYDELHARRHGADALALAANGGFDVVVLDFQLPDGGPRTCAALASFVPEDRMRTLKGRCPEAL